LLKTFALQAKINFGRGINYICMNEPKGKKNIDFLISRINKDK
jgi:hypothetical protein